MRKAAPPPPNPGPSVPVGGIVGGAVIGTVAVVGIIVFGWYKIRTRSNTRSQAFNQQYYQSPIAPNYPPENKRSEVADPLPTWRIGIINYGGMPESDFSEKGMSGNLGGNY